MSTKCERCNGSGEIGTRIRGTREAPGPVPEDARGWRASDCPDCGGTGDRYADEPDEGEDEGEPADDHAAAEADAIERRADRFAREA